MYRKGICAVCRKKKKILLLNYSMKFQKRFHRLLYNYVANQKKFLNFQLRHFYDVNVIF